MNNATNIRGAGGTPGGIGQFLVGLVMIVIGGYVFTDRVTVTSGYWHVAGYNAFGLSLIPLLFGVAWLFFDGRSVIGWLLTLGSLFLIGVGIISNLQLYFNPTSMTGTFIMLGLIAGGVGLIARSLRAY